MVPVNQLYKLMIRFAAPLLLCQTAPTAVASIAGSNAVGDLLGAELQRRSGLVGLASAKDGTLCSLQSNGLGRCRFRIKRVAKSSAKSGF
jgi:hypothetical protein